MKKTLRKIVGRHRKSIDKTDLCKLSRASLLRKAAGAQDSPDRYKALSVLFALGNFSSAGVAANHIDIEELKDKEALTIANAFLCGRRGVEGDVILERRLAAHNGLPPVASITQFGTVVARSGWPLQTRTEVLRRFIDALVDDDARTRTIRQRLKWLLFVLQRGREHMPDMSWYAEVDKFDPARPAYQLRYVDHLRVHDADGAHTELLRTVTDLYGTENLDVLLANLTVDPNWLDRNDIAIDTLAPHFADFRMLRAAGTHSPTSQAAKEVFERALVEQCSGFGRLSMPAKANFLEYLTKADRIDHVLDLAARYKLPDTILAVAVCRALAAHSSGDYYSARDQFLSVLEEDPAHPAAGEGLRLSLPRTGGGPDGMLEVRNRLGYGLQSSGRTGLQTQLGKDAIISLLMRGEYAQGFRAKRGTRHWSFLKSHFGDRFLNVEPLPEGTAQKSIFVLGDDGVGDEIRAAQFYGALTSRFDKVTVSCDPRLEKILSRSFPSITFVPVPRFRSGLSKTRVELGKRIAGMSLDLEKVLNEACRPHLDSADYITFGQTLFFNHFAGNLPRAQPGAYLKTESRVISGDKKMRVGLLWRSHMRTLWRKFMYLSIEDFLPILDLEGIEFWSMQHAMDDEERAFCVENRIRLIEDVDLFNDFDGLSSVLAGLDIATGLSSVPLELAAAVGTPVRMLGYSPENYFLRTSGGSDPEDRLTCNSRIVAPPWIDFSAPRQECIDIVMAELRTLLVRERDRTYPLPAGKRVRAS